MKSKTKQIILFILISVMILSTSFRMAPLKVQKNSLPKKEFSLNKADTFMTLKWGWMAGNKTVSEKGVYGTKGVPDTANYPGSRCTFVSWTGMEGNLWVFGGYGDDEASIGLGYLNDLWRYNITSKIWTWMAGNNTRTAYGVYGTKGVPDTNIFPGSRDRSTSWTDLKGNLWLFGGYGLNNSDWGHLNDLWRYNITSNIWTWISGNNTVDENGVYGTRGLPNIANYPGSRRDPVSLTDLDGNLWLFGGYGYNESEGPGYLSDLWRYNISSNIWTWISGNDTINENGVYSTKGIPNIANYPGSRRDPASWIDLDGDLWMLGGYGYNESEGPGYLNDLWRYNITSNIWTWMSGNNTINENGVYGTRGLPNAAIYPGSRRFPASSTDLDGNLLLFGGQGYNELGGPEYLNDFWRYNITSKIWMWISGNNTSAVYGIYGTKGAPDTANYPGCRYSPASWIDLEGNLWLFGGMGLASSNPGLLNDLWRYKLEISHSGGNPPVNPSDDDDDNGSAEGRIPGFNLLIICIFSVVSIITTVKMVNKKKNVL